MLWSVVTVAGEERRWEACCRVDVN